MSASKQRPSKKKRVLAKNFWKTKSLDDLSQQEWVALCDGCGRCCLLKLMPEDSDEVTYTRIACRLLEADSCKCGNYALRKTLVPSCTVFTPHTVRESLAWMPASCAYRLVAEGEDLPAWHPLVSGNAQSVHEAGISVRGLTIPEYEVPEEDEWDYALGRDLADPKESGPFSKSEASDEPEDE